MGRVWCLARAVGLGVPAVLAALLFGAAPAQAGVPGATLPVPTAAAAPASPTTSPAAPPDGAVPDGADPQRLSPAVLAAQVSAARSLLADLGHTSAQIAAANATLRQLSARSNQALAELARAREAEAAARAEAVRQLTRFRVLAAQARTDQASLGHWAYEAYVNGGPLADYMTFASLLAAPAPERAADPLALLHYVADARGRALDRLQGLTAEQQDAASRAESASQDALAAERTAQATKARLDALLGRQRNALAAVQQAQAADVARAGALRGALLASPDRAAHDVDARLARALDLSGALGTADAGVACTGPTLTGGYANGEMPAAALCPLYRAPGMSLRTDAARAFNAMSRAYERATGSPLCVTDSYRSYAEQVKVAVSRAGFAARPGRSHHGLGVAVDLCGGVQSFGTAAHLWMQQNGPLYGWFHPAWAEPHGVLPEPWHWEFAS